jgi:hypothetical protein
MASEIHRKRTGKGFKITEEIVMKEEMYEEEEDELPRSLRMLTSHLETGSADFNYKIQSFMANKVVMASMVAGMSHDEWLKNNPINQAFAQQYGGPSKQPSGLDGSKYQQQPFQQQPPAHLSGGQPPHSSQYLPSLPMQPYPGAMTPFSRESTQSLGTQMPHGARVDQNISPQGSTPGSATETPQSLGTATFPNESMEPLVPFLQNQPSQSPFTAEVSNDVKLMMQNFDMSSILSPSPNTSFYGNMVEGDALGLRYDGLPVGDPTLVKHEDDGSLTAQPHLLPQHQSQPDYFAHNLAMPRLSVVGGQRSVVGTPSGHGLGEEAWDAYINYDDPSIPK